MGTYDFAGRGVGDRIGDGVDGDAAGGLGDRSGDGGFGGLGGGVLRVVSEKWIS